MNKLKIPWDVEEMTKKYLIDKGGICGQACIAIIEQSTISEVMQTWESLGLEFKGWSGWNQLKKYLRERGFCVVQKNNLKSYKPEFYYIARVQWIGDGKNIEKPFYGWGHWSEASAHTHFIAILHNKWLFCNEDGLLKISDLRPYLKHYNAVITSHMEIKKKMENEHDEMEHGTPTIDEESLRVYGKRKGWGKKIIDRYIADVRCGLV